MYFDKKLGKKLNFDSIYPNSVFIRRKFNVCVRVIVVWWNKFNKTPIAIWSTKNLRTCTIVWSIIVTRPWGKWLILNWQSGVAATTLLSSCLKISPPVQTRLKLLSQCIRVTSTLLFFSFFSFPFPISLSLIKDFAATECIINNKASRSGQGLRAILSLEPCLFSSLASIKE